MQCIDAAYCYRYHVVRSVCVFLCVGNMDQLSVKTTELIEMPFGD